MCFLHVFKIIASFPLIMLLPNMQVSFLVTLLHYYMMGWGFVPYLVYVPQLKQ